ncbi:probable NOT transcription complex subunit VIP2 [Primulina huaijiensis]|uniref:probable NOT transcription complex subunit VIP2 n=1 Tax=Primulina huaijiensis TaxID=1492673 RepID=UPI003CC71D78
MQQYHHFQQTVLVREFSLCELEKLFSRYTRVGSVRNIECIGVYTCCNISPVIKVAVLRGRSLYWVNHVNLCVLVGYFIPQVFGYYYHRGRHRFGGVIPQQTDQPQPQPRFYNPLRGKEVAKSSRLGPEQTDQPQPQPQPRFYNPLRGKEVAQSSRLGPDDYGLLGLLKIIKGANPAKTSLAMGVDPHSLGLDLNSLEPLHKKFASPFSDEPVKEGPKYDIPDCYNSQQPPPLKLSHFKKFHLAMLFYIFYSMPQDQAQLFAANEIHDRGWYFHRELRMWFMRDSLPAVKNSTYEVGSYICFDPYAWQTIRQENVVLQYEMIEQRPVVPP